MPTCRTPFILLVFLLSLILVVTGCGSAGSSPPIAQTTSAATATTGVSPTAILPPTFTPLPTVGTGPLTCTASATAPFPWDTYSPTDAQGKFDDSGQQGPMTFKADGSFNRAGTLGCFVIAQQQIIFTDQVNSFNACVVHFQTGAYTWAFAGSLLSFTLVNDGCGVRSTTLGKFKWKVQP